MTIVSFLSRQRRVAVLCAATLALHYVTIDWLGNRLGTPERPQEPMRPMTVGAQLRLALPERPPVAQAQAQAEPAPKAAPVRRAPRHAPPAAPAPPPDPVAEPSAEGVAPLEEALAEPAPAPAPQVVATPPAPAVTPPPPQAGAAPQPPAVESALPAGRRFRVNPPPSARFELEVKRTDANGTKWNGVADMRWQVGGGTYQVGLDVGISMLVARVDLLNLTSEGTIDDAGIAPVKTTEKRRSRSMTATHFDHDGKRITFSASTASAPLAPGAQDKATVPFQLAAIGRGDVNQFAGDIDIQVGEDRGATVYRFQLVGEEELETKMGRLVTWRLARPPRPGSYNARLDIWLAPSLDWYPVQIRNTEGNGAVTTQTVTTILH
ncbi:uncharacterized protein DUF3108 [Pseudoduganella lurida]|uniref:Uncharacterized protein DUF3108 n=1 Tax=Pseudoduganella lurida TaxID=1036180 RepID=A0A562QWB4_9BURK|nr:DUF3108 domain-containing protein [Pseudoduganella lurida]TWI61138.1 uncharacterized protein DUF3108 [Pseudoduganella lurida]